jgi:predicted DNA-binding transcriptional regulator YafY
MAGVPVYAERGRTGGWALSEPYRTDLTGLTESELRSLVLATAPPVLADLGLDGAAERALLKLLAALPDARRREAETVREYVHVDAVGWRSTPEPAPFLPLLEEALRLARRVTLTYERAFDQTRVERTVDPLGLVAKGSAWYLVALVDDRTRTYRVSRIRALTILDEPSQRPDGFDLAATWEASRDEFRAQIPRFAGRIRVAPDAAPAVRGWWRFAEIASETPAEGAGETTTDGRPGDGWPVFDVRWDSVEVAVEYVLGLGGSVEVLQPDELRARVVDAARRLLERHRVATGA